MFAIMRARLDTVITCMLWTLMAVLVIMYAVFMLGCGGSGGGGGLQRPTRAQCDETYALAQVACDAALTDPKQHAQCSAAAVAVKMACYIVSTPEPAPSATESTEVKHASRAERWAEGLALMQGERMTPAEFEAYVTGK